MKAIIFLLLLALVLIPGVVCAEAPAPAPDPYPEEWLTEYHEWAAWFQKSQQDYTNETGYGLGVMLDFIDWAPMRDAYGDYWWKTPVECKVYYAHLFVEAYA